ncbi:MAG: CopG family transcriptional regulator [Microcoleus sp.]
MSKEETKRFNVMLTERRFQKLRQYADDKEQTMAQVFRDWIDRLPNPKAEP